MIFDQYIYQKASAHIKWTDTLIWSPEVLDPQPEYI